MCHYSGFLFGLFEALLELMNTKLRETLSFLISCRRMLFILVGHFFFPVGSDLQSQSFPSSLGPSLPFQISHSPALFGFFLWQGLTLESRLVWNSFWSPGCPWTRDSHPASASEVLGVTHPTQSTQPNSVADSLVPSAASSQDTVSSWATLCLFLRGQWETRRLGCEDCEVGV